MTIKNENQHQNQSQDKKATEVDIIESLVNFHNALIDLSSNLDKVFAQTRHNAIELKGLSCKLQDAQVLWPLKDAEQHLQMIIFLAGIGKPQFIQYDNFIVQVTNVGVNNK